MSTRTVENQHKLDVIEMKMRWATIQLLIISIVIIIWVLVACLTRTACGRLTTPTLEETLAEDIKYDARYHQIKGEKARRDQMRADWLKNFTTLDDPKKRPIDSVSEASTSAVPAKKVRIVRFEDVLEAFSNAETLSSNTLEKLVKHLRSEHELKKTPSVELLRKMQLYRSITGPAVTPYHFYKWWRFLHENSKDEVVELMDIEMQAAELILKERRERRKAVAQEPVEPEKKSYMSLFLNENECADVMDVCH
ncbi:hypothetical protein ACET3X_006132 [Alternaria dauci]|uniref:Uncharacterized protein n=1 Tax=Alternaria dauci TaxID=48095 RepID=A0ABR3UHF7_9PLEO